MARNASGIYTLPNPPVVSGTNIEASDENATRNDIATEMTSSLDRSGRGDMLAPFKATNGTNLQPSITFGSDTDSGLWRNGANDWSGGAGGVESFRVTAGVFTVPGSLVAGEVRATVISPAQITANQNDYSPAGLATAGMVRLSTDASRNVTGLATGTSGRIVALHNIGAFNLVLTDEDAASAAANRFALQSSYTLLPDRVACLQYDSTTQRWRLLGLQASAYIQTLLDDADAATARTTLGLGTIAVLAAPAGTVVGTTDAQTLTNKVHTNPDNTVQTLTDAATINWDMNSGGIASITLGGNRTMAAPTNLKRGVYILHVIQDGTGSRTITWNSVFKWTAATAPTLSTVAGRRDLFSFVCDGTNLYGSMNPDVR